jgi:hypothetical protein
MTIRATTVWSPNIHSPSADNFIYNRTIFNMKTLLLQIRFWGIEKFTNFTQLLKMCAKFSGGINKTGCTLAIVTLHH